MEMEIEIFKSYIFKLIIFNIKNDRTAEKRLNIFKMLALILKRFDERVCE